MKLRPRLAAVADLVPRGKVVADIGTDHGYLPLFLVSQNYVPKVIAVDKSTAGMEKSRRLLELFHLESKVELRRGDGLNALKAEDNVEVVIMAGLGGRTISRILHRGRGYLSRIKCLVLQPMGDDYLLRRWLVSRKMSPAQEKLALENGYFYKVMQVVHGKMSYVNPTWMEIGPRLIEEGDPLLVAYLQHKLSYYQKLLEEMEKGASPRSRRRIYYCRNKKEKIKEVLAIAGKGPAGHRADGRAGPTTAGPGR